MLETAALQNLINQALNPQKSIFDILLLALLGRLTEQEQRSIVYQVVHEKQSDKT